jgi:hypothetical protein
MSDASYTIRAMVRADHDRAIDWAAGEGWNPGIDDAGCFLATDPGGFLERVMFKLTRSSSCFARGSEPNGSRGRAGRPAGRLEAWSDSV